MAKASARSKTNIFISTLILLTILAAAAIIVCTWRFLETRYEVTARLRIAPAVLDIMTGTEQYLGTQEDYQRFRQTQALTILSTSVSQEVAADLQGEGLKVLRLDFGREWLDNYGRKRGSSAREWNPIDILRRYASNGTIEAKPVPDTEFIDVSMTSTIPEEAMKIVDSFVTNYNLLYDVGFDREGVRNLAMLRQEKEAVYDRIARAKKEIRALAKKTGATQVGSNRRLLEERTANIISELVQLEMSRVKLESRLAALQQTMDSRSSSPQRTPGDRRAHINQDPLVLELAKRIVVLKADLITVQQDPNANSDPDVVMKERLLNEYQKLLKTKADSLGEEYDNLVDDYAGLLWQKDVKAVTEQLNEIRGNEKRLKAILATEELKLIEAHNGALEIEEKQYDVDLDMEIYDTLSRRIKQLEMERNKKPRITIVERARIRSYTDPRWKYSGITVLGTVVILIMLSVIRGRLGRVQAAA